MPTLEGLKDSFLNWIQEIKEKIANSTITKSLMKLPSDNIDDYYYDYLTEKWVYKDSITQIGFENILNLIKINIDTIGTNIGLINTAITKIEAHQLDIDLNIESVKDLDIEVNTNMEKPRVIPETELPVSTTLPFTYSSVEYLYNKFVFAYTQESGSGNNDITINIKIDDPGGMMGGYIIVDTFTISNNDYSGIEYLEFSMPLRAFNIEITNNSGTRVNTIKGFLFFSKKSSKVDIQQVDSYHVLQKDSTWHVLDLSTYITHDTALLGAFKVEYEDNALNTTITIGYSSTVGRMSWKIPVINTTFRDFAMIQLNNKTISYFCNPFTTAYLTFLYYTYNT